MKVKMIIASVKAVNRKQNIERVKNIIKKQNPERKRLIRKKWFKVPAKFGIAASILTLITFTHMIFSTNDKLSQEAFYMTYYEPYPVYATFRNETKISNGLQFYKNKQYEQAIPILKYEYNLSKNDKTIIYLANAYMMTEQYQKAENILKSAKVRNANSLSGRYIIWFLGMTQIRLKKETEAITQFNKLVETDGIYNEEAKLITENV